MAEFVGLFWSSWFLKSAMSIQAAYNDLCAIRDMKLYADITFTCLTSINRHLNYLHPSLIILALADDNISTKQRAAIAEKLSKTPRPKFLTTKHECLI